MDVHVHLTNPCAGGHFVLFLVVLGWELRASRLLARALPLELGPQPFFALVTFQVDLHIFSWGKFLTTILLLMAFCTVGIMGMHQCL
jgi:hypothetical protein